MSEKQLERITETFGEDFLLKENLVEIEDKLYVYIREQVFDVLKDIKEFNLTGENNSLRLVDHSDDPPWDCSGRAMLVKTPKELLNASLVNLVTGNTSPSFTSGCGLYHEDLFNKLQDECDNICLEDENYIICATINSSLRTMDTEELKTMDSWSAWSEVVDSHCNINIPIFYLAKERVETEVGEIEYLGSKNPELLKYTMYRLYPSVRKEIANIFPHEQAKFERHLKYTDKKVNN